MWAGDEKQVINDDSLKNLLTLHNGQTPKIE